MNDYTSAFSSDKTPQGLSDFDAATPAPEYTPLPPGIYTARVVRGEYVTTKSGHDAYRITFEVTEGPHAGRTLIRTWTFSAKALPYTKRDLSAFGLTSSAQLLRPFPDAGKEYHVRLTVALQRSDNGAEFNDVKRIEVVRMNESPVAQFMVPKNTEEGII
jgi:hypothetical protein